MNSNINLAILRLAFNLDFLNAYIFAGKIEPGKQRANSASSIFLQTKPQKSDIMAKFFDQLNDSHVEFIQQQKLFFTATAPQSGRINLSPKGMDTFRILSPNKVAYLDLTGSGNESVSRAIRIVPTCGRDPRLRATPPRTAKCGHLPNSS